MNKSIALLIIGVISLAMFLIMINHFATSSTPPPLVGVQNPLPQTGMPSSTALNPPVPQAPAAPATAPASSMPAPVSKPYSSPASPSAAPSAPVASTPAKTAAAPVASAPTESATRLSPESMVSPASPAYDDVSSTRPPAAAKESSSKPAPKASAPAVKQEDKPAPAKPAKAAVKEGPKTINKIVVSATADGATVRINGASTLTYKTMHLKSPDRAVVDLEGVWAIKAPGVPGNKAVSNVRIGKQADKTRIVIDLSRTPGAVKFIKVDANTLDVRIK